MSGHDTTDAANAVVSVTEKDRRTFERPFTVLHMRHETQWSPTTSLLSEQTPFWNTTSKMSLRTRVRASGQAAPPVQAVVTACRRQ